MQVRDIMTADVACCTPDTNLQQVARLMIERDCGLIPIIEQLDSRKPVGVITDRDITCRMVAQGRNPLEARAGDCMSATVVTVGPDATVEECCQLMEDKRVRRVIVEEYGICCGIVAQADVARQASDRDTAEVLKKVSEPIEKASRV